MRCYICGRENPKDAKFCSECGTKLKAPRTEERKFVTILYSDLKGFTTLSEQKDPEEMREIIKDLFSRFDVILEKFQVGHHEYIGDDVLALFGVPTSYPDDAERAVNAGLAMQEEIKGFSKKIRVPLEMRIGINSGEVIYGEIPGKITVTGDAVNTAQRLESIADPGKVLISSTTAKLVAGEFHIIPLPPLELKGKKEKMLAFQIISPKRTYPTFLSPMIGRDQELERLKEIFEKDETHSFTIITGDVGVGKSRLLFEFQKYLDDLIPESPTPIRIISIRCVRYGTFIYQPLRELVSEILGIRESDPPATVMSKIERGALPEDPLSKHFLGFFFGIKFPDSPLGHLTPDSARQTAFVALKNLIEHISRNHRIVLILEDFHHADSGTKDFFDYLTLTEFKSTVMILLASRMKGFVKQIKKKRGKWNFIELFPIKEPESKLLIQNFFKGKEIPKEVEEVLLQKTEGNPFCFLKNLSRI